MRCLIVTVLIVACCVNTIIAQPASHVDSLYAESLGRTIKFAVLLPSGYNSENLYPVLYLLHGRGGNYQTWLNQSDIEDYIDIYPMVVVMPSGELSCYVNSYTVPNDRYEDYIIKDLQAYVNKNYAVNSENQAIAGFSLGGYGALMLGLKHPRLFQYVISIGGPLDGARELDNILAETDDTKLVEMLVRVFGEKRSEFWTDHDPFELYRRTPPEKLPYIFIISGIHDHNAWINTVQKEYADSLRNYGAYFEYHEVPGGHNYNRTCNAALNIVLQRMVYMKDNTPRSFSQMLERKMSEVGIKEAQTWAEEQIKVGESGMYYMDLAELNRLGYKLIREDNTDEAIAVYELAIQANPLSANLYDSMSDAYIAKGDTTNAIISIKSCLKLIPMDSTLSSDFASELRQIAEKKLKMLGQELVGE